MTAPCSPHPSRFFWFICLGGIACALAMPFSRRDDLLGWLLLAVMASFALVFWAFLAFAAMRALSAWHRDRPIEPDDPRVGECYKEHAYMISWDRSVFSLLTHSGRPVVQVPLPKVLDVIDIGALLMDGNVTVSTAREHVAFPKSRFERFKIERLIHDLANSCSETRVTIERHRTKFVRQFCTRLPVSLLTAAILMLPIVTGHEPQRLNLFWAVAGMAYGLIWWSVLWIFAYSLASFSAARKLQQMLRQDNKPVS